MLPLTERFTDAVTQKPRRLLPSSYSAADGDRQVARGAVINTATPTPCPTNAASIAEIVHRGPPALPPPFQRMSCFRT